MSGERGMWLGYWGNGAGTVGRKSSSASTYDDRNVIEVEGECGEGASEVAKRHYGCGRTGQD